MTVRPFYTIAFAFNAAAAGRLRKGSGALCPRLLNNPGFNEATAWRGGALTIEYDK
jgi:hypothetical protein